MTTHPNDRLFCDLVRRVALVAWSERLAAIGLEPDDLVAQVYLRLAASGGWDPSRGTVTTYVWHVARTTRIDLLKAAARAKRAGHALGEAEDASDGGACLDSECSSMATDIAHGIRAHACPEDVRLVALAALSLAAEGVETLAEKPLAEVLCVSRPLAREALRVLRMVAMEVCGGT